MAVASQHGVLHSASGMAGITHSDDVSKCPGKYASDRHSAWEEAGRSVVPESEGAYKPSSSCGPSRLSHFPEAAAGRVKSKSSTAPGRMKGRVGRLAPSPFDFINHLKSEAKVIMYPKSNERAIISLRKVGSSWEYSLERISKDRISDDVPALASDTTFAEYQRKRLDECRRGGQATVIVFFMVHEWRSRMRAVTRKDMFKKGTTLSDKSFAVQYPPRVMTGDSIRLG